MSGKRHEAIPHSSTPTPIQDMTLSLHHSRILPPERNCIISIESLKARGRGTAEQCPAVRWFRLPIPLRLQRVSWTRRVALDAFSDHETQVDISVSAPRISKTAETHVAASSCDGAIAMASTTQGFSFCFFGLRAVVTLGNFVSQNIARQNFRTSSNGRARPASELPAGRAAHAPFFSALGGGLVPASRVGQQTCIFTVHKNLVQVLLKCVQLFGLAFQELCRAQEQLELLFGAIGRSTR